jgi:septum formation topological specificity factor MinE
MRKTQNNNKQRLQIGIAEGREVKYAIDVVITARSLHTDINVEME